MGRVLGPQVREHRRLHERKGVAFHLQQRVAAIEEREIVLKGTARRWRPIGARPRRLTSHSPRFSLILGEAGLHSASACVSPSLLPLSSMHHGVRNSRRTASAPYTSLYARSQACDPSMPVLTATPFDAFNNER